MIVHSKVSPASLTSASLFFLFFSIRTVVGIDSTTDVLEILTALLGFTTSFLLACDVIYRYWLQKGPPTKTLILLLCFLVGVLISSKVCSQELIEIEHARAYAASSVAFLQPEINGPSPLPGPQPGEKCERCGGQGKIKPDGRIVIDCPDCGGDGIVGLTDAIRLFREEQSRTNAERELLKQTVLQATEQLNTTMALKMQFDGSAVKASGFPPQPGNPPLVSAPETAQNGPQTAASTARVVQFPPAAPIALEWTTDIATAKQLAQLSHKPVLVFWTGDFCEPCKIFESEVFENNEEAKRVLSSTFVLCEIKLDSSNNRDVAKEWGVRVTPTVTVVAPDWKKWDHIMVGYNAKDPDRENKFLQSLRDSYSWNTPKRYMPSLVANQCQCHETGVCTCGPNCNCQNCPARQQVMRTVPVYQSMPMYQSF